MPAVWPWVGGRDPVHQRRPHRAQFSLALAGISCAPSRQSLKVTSRIRLLISVTDPFLAHLIWNLSQVDICIKITFSCSQKICYFCCMNIKFQLFKILLLLWLLNKISFVATLTPSLLIVVLLVKASKKQREIFSQADRKGSPPAPSRSAICEVVIFGVIFPFYKGTKWVTPPPPFWSVWPKISLFSLFKSSIQSQWKSKTLKKEVLDYHLLVHCNVWLSMLVKKVLRGSDFYPGILTKIVMPSVCVTRGMLIWLTLAIEGRKLRNSREAKTCISLNICIIGCWHQLYNFQCKLRMSIYLKAPETSPTSVTQGLMLIWLTLAT